MKQEINLLPPDFQVVRNRERYRRGVGMILSRLNAGLVLVAIMLAGSYVAMRMIAANIAAQQQAAPRMVEIDQRIVQTNELIQAVDKRLAANTPWTPQVQQVVSVLPAELTLTTIAVREPSRDLTVEGVSRSRAGVVAFEQALRALPWVASIDSPLQNFATGTRTSFTIVIKRAEVAP